MTPPASSSTPSGSAREKRAVWEKLDGTLKDVLSGRRELAAMADRRLHLQSGRLTEDDGAP